MPLSTLPEFLYWRNVSHLASAEKHSYAYDMTQRVVCYHYNRFAAACDSVTSPLSTIQWASLSSTALNNMLPSLSGDNSLVNFVLELKDFKQVVRYLSGNVSKKLTALNALTGIRKGDKTLQRLSKMYLSYSFGWRPLYRDLVSFFESITGFQRRLEELIKRANTPQQRYWGTWVAGTEQSTVTHSSSGGSNEGLGAAGAGVGQQRVRARTILRETQGVRFHATLRYAYPLPPELTAVGGRLKAFLDVLGVNGNPAILWNAIPFTFIVDWLVNVSGYLERLRVDNIHFVTEIRDFCASAKYSRIVEYQHQNVYSTYSDSPVMVTEPWKATDSCVKTYYERKIGLPNYLTSLQTSGLNPREFSLTAALLGANINRRR